MSRGDGFLGNMAGPADFGHAPALRPEESEDFIRALGILLENIRDNDSYSLVANLDEILPIYPNIVNYRDDDYGNLLYRAIHENCSTEFIFALLGRGADASLNYETDNSEYDYPVVLAVRQGRYDVAKLCYDRVKGGELENEGYHTLQSLVKCVDPEDSEVRLSDEQILTFLGTLEGDFDLHKKDRDHKTAMQLIIEEYRAGLVKSLVSLYPGNCFSDPDIMSYAMLESTFGIAGLLLSSGRFNILHKNQEGMTALDCALKSWDDLGGSSLSPEDYCKELYEKIEVLRSSAIIEKSSIVDFDDDVSRDVLLRGIGNFKGEESPRYEGEIVKLLLSECCNEDRIDKFSNRQKEALLVVAKKFRNEDVVKFLESQGASSGKVIDVTGLGYKGGYTPRHAEGVVDGAAEGDIFEIGGGGGDPAPDPYVREGSGLGGGGGRFGGSGPTGRD